MFYRLSCKVIQNHCPTAKYLNIAGKNMMTQEFLKKVHRTEKWYEHVSENIKMRRGNWSGEQENSSPQMEKREVF